MIDDLLMCLFAGVMTWIIARQMPTNGTSMHAIEWMLCKAEPFALALTARFKAIRNTILTGLHILAFDLTRTHANIPVKASHRLPFRMISLFTHINTS